MEIKEFILKAVESHPADLVAYTAKHFAISVQAVHKHLAPLIEGGLVHKEGETRSTTYSITELGKIKRDLPRKSLVDFRITEPDRLEEDVIWRDVFLPAFSVLPKNVIRICEYGVTEMLNNAKDHANARSVQVSAQLEGTDILIGVQDDGIGIFRKIRDALSLGSEREAILHLSKGKFTTDPINHTGEGIFFSSRSFDRFWISTDRLAFVCLDGDDWLFDLEKAKQARKGTLIGMQIDVFSKRSLREIFDKYTVESDIPAFEKTHVVVKLGLLDDEYFISRSQAKRILMGLERFKEVLLDFRGIRQIGPSFADEIFRVYRLRNPGVALIPIHTDPDVDAMIQRANQQYFVTLSQLGRK